MEAPRPTPSLGVVTPSAKVILIMGPAACGKTTVGQRLSADLAWPFYDADDYQPKGNIIKMAQGMPLSDQDRLPWLRALHDLISGVLSSSRGRSHAILACSALKQSYRDLLRGSSGPGGMATVFLKAPRTLLEARLKARTGHFFKSELLSSQLEIIEEPEDGLTVDGSLEPAVISNTIRRALGLRKLGDRMTSDLS